MAFLIDNLFFSLLGVPRCMSRVYYLLDTISINKF
jgi:hypothetical protein